MDGRMFIQGEEVIMAYDAYNGVKLWERDLAGAVRPRVDVDGGNFSMNKDSLYVGAYDHCYRLDPGTGAVKGDFLLPDSPADRTYRWAHVSATDIHLFGSRARALPREYLALQDALVENGKWRDPSEIPIEFLDQYDALRSRYPEPADGLIEDYKRSGILWRLMNDFPDWENYHLREGSLTDRLMVSDMVFALDPESGNPVWKHTGHRIAHITISKGDGKIFFAESQISPASIDQAVRERQRLIRAGIYVERPGFPVPYKERDFRTVFALDMHTGDIVWRKDLDFTGCGGDTLASAYQDGVLLFFSSMGSHDWWRHESGALRWKRLTAMDAETGEVLWSHPNNYRTRPLVVGQKIFIEPRVCDLRTGAILTREHPVSGQPVPYEFLRPGHTCAISSASASMLFYRSSSAAITDFEKDDGLTLFGGIRPGCWINMIPASGVLLFPEASAGCTCSFPLRGTVVLKHMPKRWPKGTVFITHGPMTPVKHFAINLGAANDMRDENGTVWFAYPNPDTNYFQNHYPDYGVKFNLNEKILPGMGFFDRDHRKQVRPGSDRPWLVTSGAVGLTRLDIPLIDGIWGERPGTYTVKLGFRAPEGERKGRRVFHIHIQGVVRLEDFDIAAATRADGSVVIKEFPDVRVENRLTVELRPQAHDPDLNQAPLINFIEVRREDAVEPAVPAEGRGAMTPSEAESILTAAGDDVRQSGKTDALEKYHSVLERGPSPRFKLRALEALERLASPASLEKIAPYLKEIAPVMRDYNDPDPALKKSALRVFLAIADNISISDRDKAVRMLNRALNFPDPEDLDSLQLITSRLKALSHEPVVDR